MISQLIKSSFKLNWWSGGLFLLLIISFAINPIFSPANNTFETFYSLDTNIIFQNLSWILFYVLAMCWWLPSLQELNLQTQPIFLVRLPNRKLVSRLTLFTVVIASSIYSAIYIAIMVIVSQQTDLSFIVTAWLRILLSLSSLTILLIIISICSNEATSYVLGIILGLSCLFLKTNLFIITRLSEMVIWRQVTGLKILSVVFIWLNEFVEETGRGK
ncbi:hypothetical protein [Lactobacillus corticis]|uniref:Uncharacterized protein n=1 Tax=Lactobacillus corticis TaxID=2201249 RepID=A0A916VI33_9LACO|nr:hypothetical protein [Lactobacillus corticis]GFZ26850.1 hypothetical protein LCB40_07300 [Lactobacillus corticis]